MPCGNANTTLSGARSIGIGYFGVKLGKRLGKLFDNYVNGRKSRF